MSSYAIEISNISKRYRIGMREEIHDTFGGALSAWIKSPINNFKRVQKLSKFNQDASDDIIWAVRDISFKVKHGEIVGIIGKNGAGKSTLLKILARITEPTSGHASIHGRIASLLEVGTGFHPELTGRENVYLNGTILGMKRKEIRNKFEEIVDFSGIEKYIDTPVKRYSSGMRVRLAFSVAAHLEPEILLIDEVLAVGDTGFQKKCIGKMGDIAGQGRTVFFVTHNMSALASLCHRVILLENGRLIGDGPTNSIIKEYLSLNSTNDIMHYGKRDYEDLQSDDGKFILHSIKIFDADNNVRDEFTSIEQIEVEILFSVTSIINNLVIGYDVKDQNGVHIFRSFHNDIEYDDLISECAKIYKIRSKIPGGLLNGGAFTIEPCITVFRERWLLLNVPGVTFSILFDVPNKDHSYSNQGRPGIVSPLLKWYNSENI